jgi:peptidoglycan/LPS O-acetylase OafA/YrhL
VYHNLVPPLLAWVFLKAGLSYSQVGVANFLLSSAITLALASLSWRLLELPMNNLKRYFDYQAPANREVASLSMSSPQFDTSSK